MINKDGYHNLGNVSGTFTMTRSKFNYCRIILLTSLFWVLVDAFLILYLTDCSSYKQQYYQAAQQGDSNINNINNHHGVRLVGDEEQKEMNNIDVNLNDYDENMKNRNDRLLNVHKIKQRNKAKTSSTPKDDGKQNFLNKIKQWFREDSANEPTNPPDWPGENGRAVVIPDNLKEESKKRFKENQFNIVASDIMALNRSVPDQRSDA